MIRGTVSLPHGTGKNVRVAVFAAGRRRPRGARRPAPTSSAPTTSSTRVEGGFLDFDVAIATPDLMGQVGKLGRMLGPRGLMPNPKTGTVTHRRRQDRRRVQGAARSSTAPTATATCTCRSARRASTPTRLLENYQRRARRDPAGQAGVGQGPVPQGRHARRRRWARASRSTREEGRGLTTASAATRLGPISVRRS